MCGTTAIVRKIGTGKKLLISTTHKKKIFSGIHLIVHIRIQRTRYRLDAITRWYFGDLCYLIVDTKQLKITLIVKCWNTGSTVIAQCSAYMWISQFMCAVPFWAKRACNSTVSQYLLKTGPQFCLRTHFLIEEFFFFLHLCSVVVLLTWPSLSNIGDKLLWSEKKHRYDVTLMVFFLFTLRVPLALYFDYSSIFVSILSKFCDSWWSLRFSAQMNHVSKGQMEIWCNRQSIRCIQHISLLANDSRNTDSYYRNYQ